MGIQIYMISDVMNYVGSKILVDFTMGHLAVQKNEIDFHKVLIESYSLFVLTV